MNCHEGSIRWFFVSVVALIWAAEGVTQPVEIQAELSASGVQPNQDITVTLSVTDPADLYYFSTEVEFDPQRFEYLAVNNTGTLSGGLQVDGEISSGRVGVSVSRTDGSVIEVSGEFMELVFRSNSLAAAGTSEFQFLNSEMYDSAGGLIDIEQPGTVEIEILEGIGFMELTIPESITVTEGDPYVASGHIYASGITDDEEQAERLTAWVGVNPNNTDPSGWDESAWIEMELSDMDDPYYLFTGEIALFREVGVYYVALRTQLDDGEFFYGGLNGFWDAPESPSAQFEIEDAPAFRYTIAHWDFEYDLVRPAVSVPDNDLSEVELVGPSLSGSGTNTQGSITYLNTNGWHEQEEFNEKYIQISISTEQFENIELSSSHGGSGTGPRFFQIQVSDDGADWENLENGEIDLAEGTVHVQNISIPSEFDNLQEIHIRWLRGVDERINNEGQEIASSGTHRIGNITISGTNIDPQRVDVLPGDTNSDGIVNSMDILPLGTYWLSRGPQPVYDFITFEPREVEEWIPGIATHADANGDGVVDHRDLLPIGLNFGQQLPDDPALVMQPEPLAQFNLPALKSGEEIEILVQSSEPEMLKGLAFRFTLDGISPQLWSVENDAVPEWAVPWKEENRLLDFHQKQQRAYEAAFTYLGRNYGVEVQDLLIVRIRAHQDWPGPVFASLEWLAASRPDGEVVQLSDVAMISSDLAGSEGNELPSMTRLHQNFPNPFNPATVIRYELSGANEVRLDVFNVIGQHVTTLVESRQEAGSYAFDFDGSNLASGLYLYRLQAGETVQTKRMMLVK